MLSNGVQIDIREVPVTSARVTVSDTVRDLGVIIDSRSCGCSLPLLLLSVEAAAFGRYHQRQLRQ